MRKSVVAAALGCASLIALMSCATPEAAPMADVAQVAVAPAPPAAVAPAQVAAVPGVHPGEVVYKQTCAVCHDNAEATRSPTRDNMKAMSFQFVNYALTNGKMKDMADTREAINGKFVREVIDQPTKTYHVYGKDFKRKNRVSTFIKEHTQGTYLILTSSHALTVKDGVMIDNITKGSGSKLINRAFKVEPVITFQP